MTTPAPARGDFPPPFGITLRAGGADVAVYAGRADAVDLCLFEAGDRDGSTERRVRLGQRALGVHYDFVPGIAPGQRYAFRAEGDWDPGQGLRFNHAKLLLDPYARALEGEVGWGAEVFGHVVDEHWRPVPGDRRSELDSAAHQPRCVVVDETFDWGDDAPPEVPRDETVVYEVHVGEQTRLHPQVPEHLRGTYAGLAHPASIAHLKRLGVTTLELLPVHAFTHEPHLVRLGLANHWGYNSLGFFAPHAGYAAADDPTQVLQEFQGMVRELHRAGIEVLLDVVYNHTAEQAGWEGATLSWRGLDNRAYYRLDEQGQDVDVTGCGNTLDLSHPIVAQLVLDSLRYWVSECHVDGFRFDLAVALGRDRDGEYDPDHPFLVALRTDPVLSRVKLVAEPWDIGPHGWRTGQFPPPFAEWNDRFRDTVRRFWLSDLADRRAGRPGHGVQELAARMTGSQDLFGLHDRGPLASINFHCAHDGFTAADLTAYDVKHNEANLEGNRDGSTNNSSWNHGVEGPTDDESILVRRRRSQRNLMATTLLATGIPMIVSGDETGRSLGGNNNPYCQENELTWIHWDLQPWQEDLLATTAHLVGLRRTYPVLHQRSFFSGRQVHQDGSTDLAWYAVDGHLMEPWRWEDPGTRTIQMAYDGAWLGLESVLVVLHGGEDEVEVTLPSAPGVTAYQLVWDSAWERPQDPGPVRPPGPAQVCGTSVQLYLVTDPT